jgi:hypothetical protein
LNEFSWEIKVPILKNRLIMKQMGIAIGIPFGTLIIFLLTAKAYYGVLLVFLALLLTVGLVALIFRGTYDVRFVVNQKGILCENQPQQALRVKKLSVLTLLLGLFSKNPTVAGAGILSGTRTKVLIPWKRIRKVNFLDKQSCIQVYGGFAENIAIFCTKESYIKIKQLITQNLRGAV